MANIEAVTFDLWQTLLVDRPEWGQGRRDLRIDGTQQVLREAGQEFSRDELDEAYQQCLRTCREINGTGRELPFSERIDCFIDSIEEGLRDRLREGRVRRIADSYAKSFYGHPSRPHESASAVLMELKAAQYRIGLISNTDMTPGVLFREYMGRLDILKYFDVLTFSDEAGFPKPEKEIFEMTSRALDVDPSRMVHVGDHFINDVVGAQGVGMKAIWIRNDAGSAGSENGQADVTIADLGETSEAVRALCGRPSEV